MGINGVFGKVKSFVKDIVGESTITGIKRFAGITQSIIKPQYNAASIGSVLSQMLGENEIGDKFESSKKEKKTEEKKPQNDNSVREAKKEEKTPAASAKTATTAENKTNSVKTAKNTTKSNNETSKKVSDEDLKKLKEELRNKSIKSNINYAKLVVLLAAITGKKSVDFTKLDNNLQYALITYVMQSIDNVNKKNIPNVDKLDAVITDAALMYHFITHDDNGNLIDITEFTTEQLKEKRMDLDNKLRARMQEKLAKIAELPEEEQEAAKEALKEELAGYRKHIYEELQDRIPFECAMEGLLILSVKDLGEAAKELMESYPVELREKIANTMHSIDTLKEYIKSVEGRGEKLDDKTAMKAFRQFHAIFGTYKTKENLETYEAGLQESRRNGEFSENIYKAAEMGIGEAAYANINMTSEEKESFIQTWVSNNNDILSDADMAKVEENAKEYIQEILSKNPEIKEHFQEVKRTIKEIVEKTLDRVFDAKNENKKENKSKEAQAKIRKLITSPSGKVNNINKELLSFTQLYIKEQAEKFERPAIKKSSDEVSIALLKGIIDEKQALKNLDNSEHKFIKMCVQNSTLASMYDERIKLYIKSESDQKKLKAIAEVAPHDIVIKIVHNMRGDREKFTQELIKRHEVNHDTTVLLKKYTEKEAV